MRVAVVDIGTNSTRLLIADVDRAGAGITERHRESIVTRLGEGVEASGRLGEEPQARVFAALDRYAAEIAAHECEASTAVMTSAVRDAANGAAFAAAVRERYGLAGRTLSGDEEARFTFAGATAARSTDDPGELVVIDIGGGSTELVCGARGQLGFHVSTQIGVVRHTERHLTTDPPTDAELGALAADVDAGIAAAVPPACAGASRRPSPSPGRPRPAPRSTSRSIPTTPPRSRVTSCRAPSSTRCSCGSPRCPSPSGAASSGSIRTARRRSSPASSSSPGSSTRSGSTGSRSSDRDILWGAALDQATEDRTNG